MTRSLVGASHSPLPKAFLLSPLQQRSCNTGQGLEDESKGETRQPPARRQTRGRAGSWTSTFICLFFKCPTTLQSFQTPLPGHS